MDALVGQPREVASIIAGFLAFDALTAITQTCRTVRASVYHEQRVIRMHLTLSPAIDDAMKLIDAVGSTDLARIPSIAIADAPMIQHLRVCTHLQRLRISDDAYMLPPADRPYLQLNAIHLIPMAHLHTLDLSSSRIVNVACLAMLTQLRHLDLSHTLVTTISQLAPLVRLEVLDLEQTRVHDLGVIRSMPRLRELNINETRRLHDLTPLAHATALRVLHMNSAIVRDTAALLAIAPQLIELDAIEVTFDAVHVTQHDRYALLSAMTSLERLCMWSTRWIQTLDPLRSLTSLRVLDLRFPPFVYLPPLEPLTQLEELHIMLSLTRDTTPLRSLTRLKRLELAGCSSDASLLSFLEDLPNLVVLQCSGQIHTDVIARLIKLEELALYYSTATWDTLPQSERLPPILFRALTNVKRLTLRFPVGQPADLSAIASMTQLEMLDVRYATPKTLPWSGYFDFLEPLTALRDLQLAGGGLDDLSVLVGMLSLENLDIDATSVIDLSPLAALRALQSVSLRDTRVLDLTPLVQLPHLHTVKVPIQANCAPLTQSSSVRVLLHPHKNCRWHAVHRAEFVENPNDDDDAAGITVDFLETVFG